MIAASLRRGWCPGALRPMLTGDGLLVRIRVAGARLDLDRVEAIADCAACFGNGVIEISSRANLQLRGVTDDSLPALQRRLDELGLLDADATVEGVRNIIVSPLSDIDPTAVIDIAAVVAALEARFGEDAALRRLPPKFGFLIDGGGALLLDDVEADVRFEAFRSEEGPRFAIVLAGAEDIAAQCSLGEVPDVATALARAFLEKVGDGDDAPRRMRGLLAQCGATSVFANAGLAFLPRPHPRRDARPLDYLGVHAFGASYCVGASPSLGRMIAADLKVLSQEARRRRADDIRLTPWRALIVTGLDRFGAEDLAAALARRGFILDPADPRLAIVACSGAPACANAARAVQTDALEFASSLVSGAGTALHLSGCEKGCAHPKAAPFTLVARESGYDLVLNGKASDKPYREALSIEEAASLLARETRMPSA